ncbi:PaaI family thioesterase [Gordonia terrae]|uniref:PaaI family thioesterase n=1 Tax=Gordonia terrae TaxID=2055 RepID=UPI002009FA38|nr:PaaI family thioesterase [Gordonia terrae]UPW10088.1 PaaI family thioesterase [Gordonia terrae]
MTATQSSPEFVLAGAEALLRVSAVRLSAQRAELSVPAGGWFADPIAGRCRSALGVPLDDVTGYVVASGAPPGRWPVSLGIRLDFLTDPPVDGPPMSVTGELIARDHASGTTRGSVVGGHGELIALVTQRSHLVSVTATPANVATTFDVPTADVPVSEALGLRDRAAGHVEMPPNELAANAMGNVHGGVLLIGSEVAAMSALEASGEFRTTSIDIAYVRPGDGRNTVTFGAEVLHRGRSVAVIAVTAFNSSRKPCSNATVVVQRRRP